MAGKGGRRQNGRLQRYDRSRHGQTEAQACGSAGRLQVVQCRPDGWLVRLRWRGKRKVHRSCAAIGGVWTTDKDGLILGLLAAEITAKTTKDPSQFYDSVTADLGKSFYQRIDAPASTEQKQARQNGAG